MTEHLLTFNLAKENGEAALFSQTGFFKKSCSANLTFNRKSGFGNIVAGIEVTFPLNVDSPKPFSAHTAALGFTGDYMRLLTFLRVSYIIYV